MAIFSNIAKKAEKNFRLQLEPFNLTLTKDTPFSYQFHDLSFHSTWFISFHETKKFLSRIYKLKIVVSVPTKQRLLPENETCKWSFTKKKWFTKRKHTSYEALLNQQTYLKKVIHAVDFEKIEIIQQKDEIQMTMIPIPGSFVFTLIPPMQYFIKLQPEEIKLIKEFIQQLQDTITHSERNALTSY